MEESICLDNANVDERVSVSQPCQNIPKKIPRHSTGYGLDRNNAVFCSDHSMNSHRRFRRKMANE